MKKNTSWFTLVEVIVWVTIFSMIMISVMSIYILASDTSLKSDINRAMHENTKNIITDISEWIINNWIMWVSDSYIDSCNKNLWSQNYKLWNKLCLNSWEEYYLAKKDNSWNFVRVSNSDCEDIADQCYIVKNWIPITNSLVAIKNLSFFATDNLAEKVTLSIVLQPTTKSWVKPTQIENNTFTFQTTLNSRPF